MKKKTLAIIASICAVVIIGAAVGIIIGTTSNKAQPMTYVFETNGGSAVSSVKLNEGQEYTIPTPTKQDNLFIGWYASADLSGTPVTKIVGEANTKKDATKTYYAGWNKLYNITLNADGGNISATSVQAVSGTNVNNAVKAYEPTKEGYKFTGWQVGGNALTTSYTMPASDITLTAKYQVGYAINVYKQNLDKTGYEADGTVVVGYGDVGAKVTPEYTLKGFTAKEAASEMTLSATYADNFVDMYFDRAEYTVVFNPNYEDADGMPVEAATITEVFGKEMEVPSDIFTREGYFLYGWALEKGGEAVYKTQDINSYVYNTSYTGAADKFTVEGPATLYAVWVQGYVDMLGGHDVVYVIDKSSEEAYLRRGEITYKGTLASDGIFRFKNIAGNKTVIEGKLTAGNTYIFLNEDRGDIFYNLYTTGVGIDENVTLYFDSYNGVKYVVKDSDSMTSTSNGTYVYDDGEYVMEFVDGNLAGKTLTAKTGKVSDQDVFIVRNDFEYNLGTLYRATKNGYYPSIYEIELSGYGTATENAGSSTTTYYYTADSEDGSIITLISSSDYSTAKVIKVFENGLTLLDGTDINCYFIYDKKYNDTFENEDGTATLQLDGMLSAKYTKGSTQILGTYTMFTSFKNGGGALIIMTETSTSIAQPKKYAFLIKDVERVIEGEFEEVDGELTEIPKTEKVTVMEEMPAGYTEYFYQGSYNGNVGPYYVPLLVLQDKNNGWGEIYGRKSTGEYVLLVEGRYSLNDDVYTLTIRENYKDTEAVNMVVDIDWENLISISFKVDEMSNAYSVYYILSYETAEEVDGVYEENEETFGEIYQSTENDDTLRLTVGYMIYERGDETFTSTYYTGEGYIYSIITKADNEREVILISLNDEDHTFRTIEFIPMTAYVYRMETGVSQNEYVVFGGRDDVKYYLITTEKGDDDEDVTITTVKEGTFEILEEKTVTGEEIVRLTIEGESKNYIVVQESSASFLLEENETYSGSLDGGDKYGTLYFDGFVYKVLYVDAEGTEYEGMMSSLSIDDEGKGYIIITIDEVDRYFDVDMDEKTFTLRGTEEKTYLIVENQRVEGTFVQLDGYGNAKVYTMKEVTKTVEPENEEDEPTTTTEFEPDYIDENAKYEIKDGVVKLVYKNGNEEITVVGLLSSITISSTTYNAFKVEDEKVAYTYVNEEDLTVFVLDEFGNATKYDEDGKIEKGTYLIVTDEMIYYVNSNATDANIYRYNKENGTIRSYKFPIKAYFSADFDSLVFTRYGFVVYNGVNTYYYEIDDDGNTYVYRSDFDSAEANEYGFVKALFDPENFVDSEGNVIKFYEHDGDKLVFSRNADGTDEEGNSIYYYPIKSGEESLTISELTFTPTGQTFSVRGQLKIGNQYYDGTVYRVLNPDYEDGADDETEKYISYFVFNVTNGQWRWDFKLNYSGEGEGTYTLESMKFIRSNYSYMYMYFYYLYYYYMGVGINNVFGTIQVVDSYNTDGSYVSTFEGAFGPLSYMFDTSDVIVQFKKSEFNTTKGYAEIVWAEEDGGDGYTYRLYYSYEYFSAFGLYGYVNDYFTRLETIELEDGYTVTVERVIRSERYTTSTGAPGSVHSITLSKDGKDTTYLGSLNGTYYFTLADEENSKKTYYLVTYTEKEPEEVEVVDGETEEEDDIFANENPVMLIESVSITAIDTNTYSAENGSYIDVKTENNEVFMFRIGTRNLYVVNYSAYLGHTDEYTDEEGNTVEGYDTYIVSTGTTYYKLTVSDSGVLTYEVTEAPAPAEEEETNED